MPKLCRNILFVALIEDLSISSVAKIGLQMRDHLHPQVPQVSLGSIRLR